MSFKISFEDAFNYLNDESCRDAKSSESMMILDYTIDGKRYVSSMPYFLRHMLSRSRSYPVRSMNHLISDMLCLYACHFSGGNFLNPNVDIDLITVFKLYVEHMQGGKITHVYYTDDHCYHLTGERHISTSYRGNRWG